MVVPVKSLLDPIQFDDFISIVIHSGFEREMATLYIKRKE